MRLLRAATLNVADPEASAERYAKWFEYRIVERGAVSADLAESWGAPKMTGRPYVIAAPASGTQIYLRFVAGTPVPEYSPLRSYGWAAIEICVQDVLKVNERMERSPFTIIGPPRELDGLPVIFPMQVRGPDNEIVYLTQIRDDMPDYDLPRAASLIDFLFILVLGCSDMAASLAWFEDNLKLAGGRDIELIYTMLSEAFALPENTRHVIATMVHERDVFLECDQYPPAATPRPTVQGELPPGIAIATFCHPAFATLDIKPITPPRPGTGALYSGQDSCTLKAPDGTLVEIVDIA